MYQTSIRKKKKNFNVNKNINYEINFEYEEYGLVKKLSVEEVDRETLDKDEKYLLTCIFYQFRDEPFQPRSVR